MRRTWYLLAALGAMAVAPAAAAQEYKQLRPAGVSKKASERQAPAASRSGALASEAQGRALGRRVEASGTEQTGYFAGADSTTRASNRVLGRINTRLNTRITRENAYQPLAATRQRATDRTREEAEAMPQSAPPSAPKRTAP